MADDDASYPSHPYFREPFQPKTELDDMRQQLAQLQLQHAALERVNLILSQRTAECAVTIRTLLRLARDGDL